MATMSTVQVDAEVQRRAAEILGRSGLTVEEAVRQMLTRTANEGSLPFAADGDDDLYGYDDPAYDTWFRARVQEALDDPRPTISNEVVKEKWAKRRAELLARAT
jgi:DNA-damage-inducible protein J